MTLTAAPLIQILVTFSGSTETDITSDVLRCTITRGRSRERETMSPGRADIELWNFSGDYDPDNISGPYYPDIRPNKIVRIVSFVASTSTPFTIGSSSIGGGDAFGGGSLSEIVLFTGRLEGGTLTYAEGGFQPRVIWHAIDASKRLNRDRSLTGFGTAGDLTGERVAAVLDGATPVWPASERDIAAGTRTVQASTGDAGRYDYMNQVAASEFGTFFISKEGWAIFRDSTWEPSPAATVLGYDTGEYHFSSIEITDDEQEIYNAVTVTANALADQVQQDIGSQAEFGRTDLSVFTILDGIADMSDLAATLVGAYANPRRRISRLRVDRTAQDWDFFLSKELQDRVTVRHRPVYGGTFEQLSVIQGIQIDVNNSQDWAVTWNLAPPLSVVSNPNLLTENQTSMETSTAGWEISTGSCTIEVTTSDPFVGSQALLIISQAGPINSVEIRTTPYTTAPVVVGETYRASAWQRSPYLSQVAYVYIDWLDSGGSTLSINQGAADGSLNNGSAEWQQVPSIEAVAPSSAAYARVVIGYTEYGAFGNAMALDAVELRHVGA